MACSIREATAAAAAAVVLDEEALDRSENRRNAFMDVDRVISTELRSELNADKEARRACRAYRELSSRRLNRLDHSRIEMRDSCSIADVTMTIDITEKAAVTLSRTKHNETKVRESNAICESKRT